MKKTLLASVAALALAAFAGAAAAADSSTLNVSATVTGNCKITDTTPVSFGALDPASTTDVTAQGSVSFWCTKNTAYTLSFNDGANASGTQKRMKGPGASDFIAYSLTPESTGGTGLGKTSPITVNVDGTVAATAFENASEGAYTDAVTINITP